MAGNRRFCEENENVGVKNVGKQATAEIGVDSCRDGVVPCDDARESGAVLSIAKVGDCAERSLTSDVCVT
jgi:hypothetical protein